MESRSSPHDGMLLPVLSWRAAVDFPEDPVKIAAVVVADFFHNAVRGERCIFQKIDGLLELSLLEKLPEILSCSVRQEAAQIVVGISETRGGIRERSVPVIFVDVFKNGEQSL